MSDGDVVARVRVGRDAVPHDLIVRVGGAVVTVKDPCIQASGFQVQAVHSCFDALLYDPIKVGSRGKRHSDRIHPRLLLHHGFFHLLKLIKEVRHFPSAG